MQEQINHVDMEEKLVVARRIIAALSYLHHNCPMHELKPILKVSLDLCAFIALSRPQNMDTPDTDNLSAKEFVEALEYLKNEASKNKLNEIETILFASFSFCNLLYSFSSARKISSATSSIN